MTLCFPVSSVLNDSIVFVVIALFGSEVQFGWKTYIKA